jgi:hypothetical protein
MVLILFRLMNPGMLEHGMGESESGEKSDPNQTGRASQTMLLVLAIALESSLLHRLTHTHNRPNRPIHSHQSVALSSVSNSRSQACWPVKS